jgi:hypothetical protein
VGVVDAEDADAAVDPEFEDTVEGVPEAAPVGELEVEGVDVLIFFGRIFGVLDGAVGTVIEPGGMFLDPGVIGGALKGDVEVEVVGAGGVEEGVEVGEGAEGGKDCGVAAFCGAYCPGAAYVVGFGGGGVVAALVEGSADGVDGREVEDVEAHGGGLGDARGYVVEGAVGVGSGRCGAGEEFVPDGEAGALALDPERELGGMLGGEGEVGIIFRRAL